MAVNWGEKTPEEWSADALEALHLKTTLDVLNNMERRRLDRLSPEELEAELQDAVFWHNVGVFLVRAAVAIVGIVLAYGFIAHALSL